MASAHDPLPVWPPRRMDIPSDIVECKGSPCYQLCDQGRKCSLQQPVVSQVQRYRITHPTPGQRKGDIAGTLVGAVVIVCLVMFGAPLLAHLLGRAQ